MSFFYLSVSGLTVHLIGRDQTTVKRRHAAALFNLKSRSM